MATKEARASPALDALGHETRREILVLLKAGPLPVGEIAERLPISRPAVSKHLRILERAGLVEHRPQGTQNIFRLRLAGFSAARAYLESFWDEALAGFQHLAERAEEAER
jgi:DNA-binding transcriptional ArsR family regulator